MSGLSAENRDLLPVFGVISSIYLIAIARRQSSRYQGGAGREPRHTLGGRMPYHDHQLPVLTTFGQFRPTALDVRGVGSNDNTREWGVSPVMITRDSRVRSLANWSANLESIEAVDPDGEDHEVCRFRHWGPGWIEIVIVRPGSKAERVARENAASLDNYPVLDESKWTEMEMEAVTEWWSGLSLSEKIRECADNGESIFAARHYRPPEKVEDNVRGEL